MTSNSATSFTLMVLSCLTLASCSAAVDPSAARTGLVREDYAIPYNSVGFLDRGLEKTIVVEQFGGRRSPTDRLVSWLTLRNRSDASMRLLVRTRFFGKDKKPLDTSAWNAIIVESRSLGEIQIPSLTAEAEFFFVEIGTGR